VKAVLAGIAILFAASTPAASASANAVLISITSPVQRGGSASIAVHAATTGACTIRVRFGSGAPLVRPGLGAKGTLFSTVRWTWTMPRNARRGRWSVDVRCGAGNSLHATFLVR
jgi:hypothetical protein